MRANCGSPTLVNIGVLCLAVGAALRGAAQDPSVSGDQPQRRQALVLVGRNSGGSRSALNAAP